MREKTITICPNCGEPMIWTFAFSGSEYYCLMCGYSCGIFGAKKVEETKKLKYQQKLYKRIFREINKDLIPVGAYFKKCEKCKSFEESHLNHATELELLKQDIAIEILEKISKEVG